MRLILLNFLDRLVGQRQSLHGYGEKTRGCSRWFGKGRVNFTPIAIGNAERTRITDDSSRVLSRRQPRLHLLHERFGQLGCHCGLIGRDSRIDDHRRNES